MNALINIVTDVFFGDWHGLFWIPVIQLFIIAKEVPKLPKLSKNGLQKGYFWRHFSKTPKQTQQSEPDFLSEYNCEIFDTHRLFPLFALEARRYTTCKTLCLTFIDNFSAACRLCLYGSAEHKLLCVFILASKAPSNIPKPYASRKMSIYHLY